MSDSLKNSAYIYDSIANDAFDPAASTFFDLNVAGRLTAGLLSVGTANITTANIQTLTTSAFASLNVTGTGNIFGLSSNTAVIDSLRVANLYLTGNTFNVTQNILTSNSLNVYNYGSGPALRVTQVTGIPSEAVALFTAINDHPSMYINGLGTILVNPPPGDLNQQYANTELEVNGNIYVSSNAILSNIISTLANITVANIGSLSSTGTPVFANLLVSNTVTSTNISVSGNSNLATGNVTTLTSTGTSNLATANVSTLTSSGTPVFANLLVSNTVT